jgi:hypothetical protein
VNCAGWPCEPSARPGALSRPAVPLTDERDRDRMGADAVARDAACGAGRTARRSLMDLNLVGWLILGLLIVGLLILCAVHITARAVLTQLAMDHALLVRIAMRDAPAGSALEIKQIDGRWTTILSGP